MNNKDPGQKVQMLIGFQKIKACKSAQKVRDQMRQKRWMTLSAPTAHHYQIISLELHRKTLHEQEITYNELRQ